MKAWEGAMKQIRVWLIGAALVALAGNASAKTILFVGNSFTFGQHSAVKHYKPDTVRDLNKTGIGGVPALCKAFADQAGLDYQVSVETVGGKGLDYHYTERLALLDRPWDEVVLQSYSTLDQERPRRSCIACKYVQVFSDTLHRRNPAIRIFLDATWSRADMTYAEGTPWHGKAIEQTGKDVEAGYWLAARKTPGTVVIPVGRLE